MQDIGIVEEDKQEDEVEDIITKTHVKASNARDDRRSMSMLSPHEQDHYNKMTFGDEEAKKGEGIMFQAYQEEMGDRDKLKKELEDNMRQHRGTLESH